jgi:outer membrane protein
MKSHRTGIGALLKHSRTTAVAIAAILAILPNAASAESLREALASAYRTNPVLDAARATLRATDESVPQARAGFLPTITGTAGVSSSTRNSRPASATDGRTSSSGYGIGLDQNIFQGFRIINSVNRAEALVRAGRETLRTTEQVVLLDAVTVYMDVVRDQAILRVRENNVRVLTNELRATRDRFGVGEVTRTDVAQAEARRAGAVSDLDLARSNLRTSIGNYVRIIGHPPGRVADQQPIDRLLPKSLEAASEVAIAEHPTVVGAIYIEQAARHDIDIARGARLPSVALSADYNKNHSSGVASGETESTIVQGNVTWRFWDGGATEASIRAAKHTAVRRLQEIEQARTVVRAGVVTQWSALVAARAQLISAQQQLQAANTALAGVREEEKVGQRTLIDVLNAQQEALLAELALITTRRNLVVASYAVLSAVGRLDAHKLSLNSPIYDETANYERSKHKLFDTRIEYADGRVESAAGRSHEPMKLGTDQASMTNAKPPVAARPAKAAAAPKPSTTGSVAPVASPWTTETSTTASKAGAGASASEDVSAPTILRGAGKAE